MALNPSLSATPIVQPQRQSISSKIGEILTLKRTMQAMKDDEATRELFRTATTREELLSGARKTSPQNFMDLTEHFSRMDTQTLQQNKVRLETQAELLKDYSAKLRVLSERAKTDPYSAKLLLPQLGTHYRDAGLDEFFLPPPDADIKYIDALSHASETAAEHARHAADQASLVEKNQKIEFDKAAEARAQEKHDIEKKGGADLMSFMDDWAGKQGLNPGTLTAEQRMTAREEFRKYQRAPVGYQSEVVKVAGKPKVAYFNPTDGKVYDPDTNQVIPNAERFYQPPGGLQGLILQNPQLQDEYFNLQRKTALARVGITNEQAAVDQAAKGITEGLYQNPSQIPQVIRGQAISKAVTDGGFFISQTDKDAVRKLNVAESILDDIEYYIRRIQEDPTDVAANMTLNGLRQATAGVFAKGVFAEVGVLTEGDVGRVKSLIPGIIKAQIMDETTREQLKELRQIIGKTRSEFGRSPKELLGGLKRDGQTTPTTTPRVIEWERDPRTGQLRIKGQN